MDGTCGIHEVTFWSRAQKHDTETWIKRLVEKDMFLFFFILLFFFYSALVFA